MKRGPLDRIEKFYIEGNVDKPLKELALALNRSEETISKYIETLPTPEPVAEPAPAPKKRPAVMEMMNGKEGNRGYTIMTQGASEIGDDARSRNQSKRFKDGIAPVYPE